MELLRGLHNPGLNEVTDDASGNGARKRLKCVATIGNFDGIHLGHQAIIRQVMTEAKKRQLPSLVVIFEPQPMEFFKGPDAPARLMRFREKFQTLSQFDLDYIFCLKFDESLSKLSAEEFIRNVLVSHLSIAHLVVGDDFRFGGDRLGDFDLLCDAGKKLDFSVENTPTVLSSKERDTRVSSTHVRSLLEKGDFSAAEQALGRPYSFFGRVIHGEKLGRTLGFPTANVALKRLRSPFKGVFAVSVVLAGRDTELKAVANIGVKPTVGHFGPSMEVHIFDFDEDIYGQKIQVVFHEKIRDEKRFGSLDELKANIRSDVDRARTIFSLD
jgi:riboflavin kinase/FMN adenylyltransferase